MSHIVRKTLYIGYKHPKLALHSIFRGTIAIGIVLGGMTGQTIQAMSGEYIQHPVSTVLGAICTLTIVPALLVAALGALGLPHTWISVVINNTGAYTKIYGFFNGIMRLIATGWQLVAYLPLSTKHDKQLKTWELFFFREPDRFYDAPAYQKRNAIVKDEYWIYCNGIATTKDIADYNRQVLYEMVGRPINLVHNPTDGVLVDLIECLVGKLGIGEANFHTKPRKLLFDELRERIKEAAHGKYKRVVLVAHSQGTIISSGVLQDLQGEAEKDPQFCKYMENNFEVYMLANAAHRTSCKHLCYLENLSNGRDTVSWLGVQFPVPDWWRDIDNQPIHIEGISIKEPNSYGHMYQAHYMDPLRYHKAFHESRLNEFRDGAVPPPPSEEKKRQVKQGVTYDTPHKGKDKNVRNGHNGHSNGKHHQQ